MSKNAVARAEHHFYELKEMTSCPEAGLQCAWHEQSCAACCSKPDLLVASPPCAPFSMARTDRCAKGCLAHCLHARACVLMFYCLSMPPHKPPRCVQTLRSASLGRESRFTLVIKIQEMITQLALVSLVNFYCMRCKVVKSSTSECTHVES
eukprot:1779013-Amphidinium_carterae.4